MSQIKGSFSVFFIILLIISCNYGPKSKEPYTITRTIDKSILDPAVNREMHKVVVSEVSPTSRYVYALVEEGDRKFWISTGKKDLKKGETYYYNESILKTQFESKELNKVFDTIYLVTTLVSGEHGKDMQAFHSKPLSENNIQVLKKTLIEQEDSTAVFAGRIRIADLVDDPEEYKGKKVELQGTVTKVNPGIMGRNWIHLQDGSKDSYDLVITSDQSVEKGAEITIRGLVALNVDFGSGYSYPILLEKGVLVE